MIKNGLFCVVVEHEELKIMIYKLSNAVEREHIEAELGIPFKYPHIYSPTLIINGFNETNLSVVTMQAPYEINYAIWGLMPQNFKEDWHIFQNNANTLNVSLHDLENIRWMKESLRQRRCLIIVSGFYTHLLHNGGTSTYHLYKPSQRPFMLAGVYNILEDGFYCSALITSSGNTSISSYHDLSNMVPVVIRNEDMGFWLSKDTSLDQIRPYIEKPPKVNLKAELINNGIFSESLSYTPDIRNFNIKN
ncbi:hypothetical protein D2V93_14390 [Flagellimonas taeanensis]|uniref:Abasic site processing protein n=2 Tax=Flavobacteriales TaxID=200644 RepID=A0A1M6PBC5_9FLAO|nr:hypothetical protein D2V93_14390 [Allomuricauda taeanensis]SFB66535.1 SOS response associated peptidase (SRAP) [Allomuricauda taeanensis]SHK05271.1 SOS response associated peptidase (SRAP) [Allomuricauda taeanensis]